MLVDGKNMRPIWLNENPQIVNVIDQRRLPHQLVIADLCKVDDAIEAIREMYVRGAPLIGATGAWAVYLAAINAPGGRVTDDYLNAECSRIASARPTAVNLEWAVDRVQKRLQTETTDAGRLAAAREEAEHITEEEAENCRRIGEFGLHLIQDVYERKNRETVNILTHCNAGWLACVEWGTATAPMYAAHNSGVDIHIWVDETRPLNQGARLTAWELGKHGIRHTVIADNAGGHLMQHGMVDMVIVGTDRSTHTGDVANKIGTYLKALAAFDNGVPFYVALPSSTFDWKMTDGLREIPIETRDPDEIRYIQGLEAGSLKSVLVPPAESAAGNYAFDVTPARLVTGFITERGVCAADRESVLALFPEKKE